MAGKIAYTAAQAKEDALEYLRSYEHTIETVEEEIKFHASLGHSSANLSNFEKRHWIKINKELKELGYTTEVDDSHFYVFWT